MSYSYTLDDGAGAQFRPVLELVNDVCEQLGLGTITQVYGDEVTDPNVIQLRALLKSVGRKLALKRDWSQLQKEYEFDTEDGVSLYAVPDDFSRLVPQTSWNRTEDLPFVSTGAVAWQFIKGVDASVTYTAIFRPRVTTLELWPQPVAAGETIAFEYLSRYWVASDGETEADKDAPDADTDTVLFDHSMMVDALKLAFRKEKGFDTTAAQADFDEAYGLAESANENDAPVLGLSTGRRGVKLIGGGNVPDTGYGE